MFFDAYAMDYFSIVPYAIVTITCVGGTVDRNRGEKMIPNLLELVTKIEVPMLRAPNPYIKYYEPSGSFLSVLLDITICQVGNI